MDPRVRSAQSARRQSIVYAESGRKNLDAICVVFTRRANELFARPKQGDLDIFQTDVGRVAAQLNIYRDAVQNQLTPEAALALLHRANDLREQRADILQAAGERLITTEAEFETEVALLEVDVLNETERGMEVVSAAVGQVAKLESHLSQNRFHWGPLHSPLRTLVHQQASELYAALKELEDDLSDRQHRIALALHAPLAAQ